MKHLKFVPKNKTLTAKSSTANKLSEFNLEDMMQSFGSNIPVQESSERLKKNGHCIARNFGKYCE